MARQTPRSDAEISEALERLKTVASDQLRVIHLAPADFKRVRRSPALFDCTAQPDGSIVTVFRGRLVKVQSN